MTEMHMCSLQNFVHHMKNVTCANEILFKSWMCLLETKKDKLRDVPCINMNFKRNAIPFPYQPDW